MSYHDAFRQSIDARFEKDAEARSLYTQLARRMNTGDFERSYIDVFLQKWDEQQYDAYDAWLFGQVHSMAVEGDANILEVDLGCAPSADRAVEVNNEKLARLPEPFVGRFWGGTADFDGEIGWPTEITLQRTQRRWSPDQVVLEVGNTRPATTWLHLRRRSSLARWPYGSTSVYILRLEREAWRRLQPPSLLKPLKGKT